MEEKELKSINLYYSLLDEGIKLPKYTIQGFDIGGIELNLNCFMCIFRKKLVCNNFSILLYGSKVKKNLRQKLFNINNESLFCIQICYTDGTWEEYHLSKNIKQNVKEVLSNGEFKHNDILIESIRRDENDRYIKNSKTKNSL